MCGRTACTLAPDDVVGACTYRDRQGKKRRPCWKDAPSGKKYYSSYNVAPSLHTPVLVSGKHFDDSSCGSERVVIPMKWGLTPPWHQGDPYKVPYETNNCRVEGMLEKRTYKVPLQKGNRCVVLADGFFEWKTTKEGKQPYFFYFPQPDGVKFPITPDKTEKPEPKTEVREESKEAIKREILSNQNVKHEKVESAVKHEPDDKIKTEIKQEISSPDSPKTCQTVDSVKAEVIAVKSEEAICKSFWDSVPENNNRECDKGIESMSADLNEKCAEDEVDGSMEEEQISEWHGPRLLTMAGVFDVWKSPDGSGPLYSYAVITVPASSDMDWCHHRMPAILSTEEEVQDWLDFANIPLQKASALIKPQKCLTSHPVSKSVNNIRYKNPDCVKPIDLSKQKVNPSSSMMMNWLKSGSPAKKKKVE